MIRRSGSGFAALRAELCVAVLSLAVGAAIAEDQDLRQNWELEANQASALAQAGRVAEAADTARRALESARRAFGEEGAETLRTILFLAYLEVACGRPAEALGLYESCLEKSTRVLGDTDPVTQEVRARLALLYLDLDRYGDAEPLLRRCAQEWRRDFGPEHPSSLAAASNLANALRGLGRMTEAGALYEETIQAASRALGETHPTTLVAAFNLALLFDLEGRHADAESLGRQTLERLVRTLGEEHLYTLACATNLAGACNKLGRHAEAEGLAASALERLTRLLGERHPHTLKCTGILAIARRGLGRFGEAVELMRKHVELEHEVMGADHPDALISKHQLALCLAASGRLWEAESVYKECLEASARVLGELHASTLETMNDLGVLFMDMRRFREARPLLARSHEAYARARGEEDSTTLRMLYNLAVLERNEGRLDEAERLFDRCLEARRRLFGAEDPSAVKTEIERALVHQAQGRSEEAERSLRRCLEVQGAALGESHAETLQVREALAIVEFDRWKGRAGNGETLLRSILEGRARLLGREDPRTLDSLNALAHALIAQGRYIEAVPFLEERLEAHFRLLGAEDVAVAEDRIALASALYWEGKSGGRTWGDVEGIYRSAIATLEQSLGREHELTLSALSTLAFFYSLEERWNDAEALEIEIHEGLRVLLGEAHSETNLSRWRLGRILRGQGRYAEAEAAYRLAIEALGRFHGRESPSCSSAQVELATLLVEAGRPDEGVRFLVEASRAQEAWLGEVLPGLSSDARHSVARLAPRVEGYLLALAARAPGNDALAESALEATLARKGLVNRAAGQVERIAAIERDAEPELARALGELRHVRAQLARLWRDGASGSSDEDATGAELARLRSRREDLEREIGGKVEVRIGPSFRGAQVLAGVRGALLPEEALVEYISTPRRGAGWRSLPGLASEERYFAVVAAGGGGGRIHVFDVGSASKIDEEVERLRRALQDPSGLANPVLASRTRNFHDRVWAPLRPALGGARRVYLALDGELHLVPFAALGSGPDRCLVEEIELVPIGDAHDYFGDPGPDEGASAIVVGAVDYGPAGGVASPFSPLPGAALEAKEVSSLLEDRGWAVETIEGRDAAEAALASRLADATPALLHLATHGFFLEVEDRQFDVRIVGPETGWKRTPDELWRDLAAATVDPLARSGVALAGANLSASDGQEDGRLTALEVLALPLSGTDLVVLSACDTGVGVVRHGEGVGSIAAAFVQAGAKGVLMTLWPVADQPARRFLSAFYERYLIDRDAQAALRATQLECLEGSDPALAAPATWAAFVVVGG